MLFRAVFWIGVIIVLIPRVLNPMIPMISRDLPIQADMLAEFQTSVLTTLARVKADLKVQRARRALQSRFRSPGSSPLQGLA